MKPPKIYHFESCTEAHQAANLYYINTPFATSIQRDNENKVFTIFSRFHTLARFIWA